MGFLGVLAAIILAILFGYFALLNQNTVPLNLGPFPVEKALLHEIAGFSALAGAFVSAFALLAPLWRSSRTIRALRRQIRALEDQNKALQDATAASALYSDNSSLLPPAHATAVARADEEPV